MIALYEWWHKQHSVKIAKDRYWENHTDEIRSLASILPMVATDHELWLFALEIHDAVAHLGLESYWWDWCKGHFPKHARRVQLHRQEFNPSWL